MSALAPLLECERTSQRTRFMSTRPSTATPGAATHGPTAANAWADLRGAVDSVNTSGAAKLYWLCGLHTANRAATLDAAGLPVFSAMSATGGELCQIPALVSAGVPTNELILIDGNSILAATEAIIPRETQEADLLMSTTPAMNSTTPTATQMTSMWQTDSTGVIAEAVFSARVMRDAAVYTVTGVNWGG
jgi:hypothetical protein